LRRTDGAYSFIGVGRDASGGGCCWLRQQPIQQFYRLGERGDWRWTFGKFQCEFNDMSIGTFNGGFYTVSDGVTMSVSGGLGSIDTGAGPGQGNQACAIPGEGVHAASNFLFGSSSTGTLIIDFGTEVFGAGLSLIDQFSNNSTNIEAFSDVGATGTSLGLFSGLSSNFQNNGAYFMGLTSDIGFRLLIFRDLVNNGGDTYGIDDIVFATGAGGGGAVPEPGMLTLLGVSLLGFGAVRRGRRKLG
jgi:hypothetical protein